MRRDKAALSSGCKPHPGKETGLSSGATFVVSVVDGSFTKDYTATAKANGSWDATIPSAGPVILPNGTATITAQANSVKVSEKVTVDETLPTVLSVVASPSKGDLDAGKVVILTADFSEKVTVTGHPVLKLNDGGLARYGQRLRDGGAHVRLHGLRPVKTPLT